MNESSLESKTEELPRDGELSVETGQGKIEPSKNKLADQSGQEEEAVNESGSKDAVHPPLFEGDPEKQWYVLRARSGFEQKIRDAVWMRLKLKKMENLVEDVFVPGEDVTRIKMGKKRKTHLLYFSGYVLIKMKFTNELWHLLVDIPNVSGFVGGTNEEPRCLSKKELTDIAALISEGIHQEVMKEEYEVGQQVMIVEGPFVNFSGEIASVETEKSRLRVMINILGRATPVELDFTKVRHHTGEEA